MSSVPFDETNLSPGAARRVRGLASMNPFRGWDYAATGRLGLIVMGLFMIAVTILVAIKPGTRSVAMIYAHGALGWWQGKDIFGPGEHGFIYLPSFAILYSPFAFMGPALGGIVWRLLGFGVLVYSLWQAIGVLTPNQDRHRQWASLGVVLLILVFGASGALRNGQATPIMFGLTLLSAIAMSRQQWWRAALMVALAFAIKPLAIVFILLAAGLYPLRMGPRLVVAITGFMLLPLINIHPAVALHQYELGIQKLMVAGAPGYGRWSDITAPFHKVGVYPPEWAFTALRVVTALGALALGKVAISASKTPAAPGAAGSAEGLISLFDISTLYLLLMCPRTEGESYLMLGAILGLHVVALWDDKSRPEHSRRIAWWLVAGAVTLGDRALPSAAFHALDLWFKPLVCLALTPLFLKSAALGANAAHPLLFARHPDEHQASGVSVLG